jgi:4,5-DOPA dioxygenase extradiol
MKEESKSMRMPVLFIGHGSPMNAIEDNEFTRALSSLGDRLEKPKAVLCVSAHWLTDGTLVTSSAHPKMIYDMYGFPEELYRVQYPAKGSIEVATLVTKVCENPKISFDDGEWGLDHGTWSVLKYLFPDADVPVLQLSLDMSKGPDFHFDLGKRLRVLRDSGVMIIGSGNVTHNLRAISRDRDEKPFIWAAEFDEWFKTKLIARDFKSIIHDYNKTPAGAKSVPAVDHWLPIHYVLGASAPDDDLVFEYEGMQNGSLSMRTFRFG